MALQATRVRIIGPQPSSSTVQRSAPIAVLVRIAWTPLKQIGSCLRARSQQCVRPDLAAWDC